MGFFFLFSSFLLLVDFVPPCFHLAGAHERAIFCLLVCVRVCVRACICNIHIYMCVCAFSCGNKIHHLSIPHETCSPHMTAVAGFL